MKKTDLDQLCHVVSKRRNGVTTMLAEAALKHDATLLVNDPAFAKMLKAKYPQLKTLVVNDYNLQGREGAFLVDNAVQSEIFGNLRHYLYQIQSAQMVEEKISDSLKALIESFMAYEAAVDQKTHTVQTLVKGILAQLVSGDAKGLLAYLQDNRNTLYELVQSTEEAPSIEVMRAAGNIKDRLSALKNDLGEED